MGRLRNFEHSLGNGAHPVQTGLITKAPTHTCLRRVRTKGKQQDGGRRVEVYSYPQLAIPLPLPYAFYSEQDMVSAPHSVRMQASTNYYAAQQEISEVFLP